MPPVQDLKVFISSGLVSQPYQHAGTLLPLQQRAPGPLGHLRGCWRRRDLARGPPHTAPCSPPPGQGAPQLGSLLLGVTYKGMPSTQQQAPGELCARCLVIYWDCVHKNKIKTSICVHPTASHRGMHEILLNTSVLQVLAPCPYLQTYGRQQINPRKKQMFVVIFFENLRFSD